MLAAFACFVCLETPQLLTDSTAVTSYLSSILFEDNFHEVVADRFYRSARMSNQDLRETIHAKGIKTVINLSRGGDTSEGEEISERDIVEAENAKYLEIPLNGKRLPSRDRLLPLLSAYETAPLPILVHCSSGTHRSGLASAIWLLEQESASLAFAEKQLSPRYGFFYFERKLKSYFEGRATIDELLWQYQRAVHSRQARFSSWALDALAPYDADDEMQNQCSVEELDLLHNGERLYLPLSLHKQASPPSTFELAICSDVWRRTQNTTGAQS